MHADSWFITIVLFMVSYFLLQAGKRRPHKITHMILRLFYLIMLISGIGLLISVQFPVTYVIKAVLAIVLIGLMEMILIRGQKHKKVVSLWGMFIIILLIVVLLGFR